MASDHFYLFTALAAFNREVQEKIKNARSAEEVLSIASSHGYKITIEQLRHYSSKLSDDYWSWKQESSVGYDDFFGNAKQLKLQTS